MHITGCETVCLIHPFFKVTKLFHLVGSIIGCRDVRKRKVYHSNTKRRGFGVHDAGKRTPFFLKPFASSVMISVQVSRRSNRDALNCKRLTIIHYPLFPTDWLSKFYSRQNREERSPVLCTCPLILFQLISDHPCQNNSINKRPTWEAQSQHLTPPGVGYLLDSYPADVGMEVRMRYWLCVGT